MILSLLLPLVLGIVHLPPAERPIPAVKWTYCWSSGKVNGESAVVYSGTFGAPAEVVEARIRLQFISHLDAYGPAAFNRESTRCSIQFGTEGRARASLTNDLGRTKSRDIRVMHSRFHYVDDR